MLSIGKLHDVDYYLDAVAASVEDYYLGDGEAPGVWLGEGSAALGLSGEVDGDALRAVLSGCMPGGEALVAGKAMAAGRLQGYDLTFSAPKSVSLLYGLGDDAVSAAARAAHDAAVVAALGYLGAEAAKVRRGHDGLQVLPAAGFVAAGFRHRSSRAGDPQLHTHVLTANLARGPDGRWSALDGRQLYVHARTAGFLYQAALRAELVARLGVQFGPVRAGVAEVTGFSDAQRAAFSQRRAEIVAAMAERGVVTARGAQAATLDTRRAKVRSDRIESGPLARSGARDYGVEPGSLGADWRKRAADLGLDEATVVRLCGPGRAPAALDEAAVTAGLLSPSGLTAAVSSFDRRDVLRGLAEAAAEGADVEGLRAMAGRVCAAPGLVTLGDGARGAGDVIRLDGGRVVTVDPDARYSTADLLAVETAVFDRARAGMTAGVAIVDPAVLRRVMAARPTLSAEQTAMVTRLVGSGAGVEVVIGAAGTGKTFALDAARAAWQSSGLHVAGATISARAASELTAGSGIEAVTVAQLFADAFRPGGGLARGGVLVVDEAGMVGTRTLGRLVDLAARTATKLVLVGDPAQLPEITAGGTLAALADRVGATRLVDNRRQAEEWERRALDALRAGRVADAVAAYGDRGRVHLAPTAEAAMIAMVTDWMAARAGGSTPATWPAPRCSPGRAGLSPPATR